MTPPRLGLLTAAIALAITSCAQPAHQQVVRKAGAAAAKPEPLRMNKRGKVSAVSLPDLFALQQSGKVLLYDARPGFFYGLGHIPGAISLPKANCEEQIARRETEIRAALAAHKTIVVYCTRMTCPDARSVAIRLADAGYSCSSLPGGWESWKDSGLPAE